MKRTQKHIIRACVALFSAFLFLTSNLVVYAEPLVEELTEETSSLKQELSGLKGELSGLSSEISILAAQLEENNSAVTQAEYDLAAAKLNEQMQYEDMKKRIKYMYEEGNSSMLEIIFSSQSMGEFLNNTEFVETITEYDRNMLNELQEIHADVLAKEAVLKEQQTALADAQESLSAKRTSLNDKITATEGQLDASSQELADAKAAQTAADNALKKETGSSSSSGAATESGGNNGSNGAITTTPPTSVETNELVLLAGILECEAGSTDYDALLAVATVIMNRVASSKYPNSIQGVIYQKGQFPPATNGKLGKILARGPKPLCYQVAQDALGGARLSAVSGCYSFNFVGSGQTGIIVGGNAFY